MTLWLGNHSVKKRRDEWCGTASAASSTVVAAVLEVLDARLGSAAGVPRGVRRAGGDGVDDAPTLNQGASAAVR